MSATPKNKTLSSLSSSFQNLFSSMDRLDKITIDLPGNEGSGPWNDPIDVSIIPARKLIVENTDPSIYTIHIMTVGMPQPDGLRRIKIYEHTLKLNGMEGLIKNFKKEPENALRIIVPLLKNPQSVKKLCDKVMDKDSAIKALTGAQLTLLPLFGNWLNPTLCSSSDLLTISKTIYLCSHSLTEGTVAKVVKKMDRESNREEVKEYLTKALSLALESYWDENIYTGFSLAVAIPPARNSNKEMFY